MCAEYSTGETMVVVIDGGGSIDLANKTGQRSLLLAAGHMKLYMVSKLIQYNCDVTLTDSYDVGTDMYLMYHIFEYSASTVTQDFIIRHYLYASGGRM